MADLAALEKAVADQGATVRELKAAKAGKAEIDAAVKELLARKEAFAAAGGEIAAPKKDKKKEKKEKKAKEQKPAEKKQPAQKKAKQTQQPTKAEHKKEAPVGSAPAQAPSTSSPDDARELTVAEMEEFERRADLADSVINSLMQRLSNVEAAMSVPAANAPAATHKKAAAPAGGKAASSASKTAKPKSKLASTVAGVGGASIVDKVLEHAAAEWSYTFGEERVARMQHFLIPVESKEGNAVTVLCAVPAAGETGTHVVYWGTYLKSALVPGADDFSGVKEWEKFKDKDNVPPFPGFREWEDRFKGVTDDVPAFVKFIKRPVEELKSLKAPEMAALVSALKYRPLDLSNTSDKKASEFGVPCVLER